MFKLRRFLRNYKLQLIIGPLCKLIEAIFELIVPLVMANIIDVGVKSGDTAYVWRMGGLMVLLGALGLCSALVCQKSASITSQGFGTQVRNAMFKHINTLSHRELDSIGTPSLITRMTNDINQLQLAVAMLIRLVIRAPFLVIGAIVMAMTISIKLSLIFIVAAVVMALVLYLVMNRSVPFFKSIQQKLDRLSLISRENLSGSRVIRAFSKQESEKQRFEEKSDDLAKTAIKVGRLSALLNPATNIIINLAIMAIIWFGGVYVNIGDLTQGEIIALVNYMTQILLAMIVVANLVVIFTKASASAARVNEVFETQPSVTEGDVDEVKESLSVPKISFNNVSFAYGKGEYALENISFSAEKGETVGIIGGTGSGKSTLVNLIPRFYDVNDGEVLIDGVNVKEYSFDALRGKIGITPQKSVLFSGTIKSNMLWGNPNASDEDIEWALKVAQAYDFVSKLDDGINSQVLAGGKNFSGGQRQRLTIARAIVRKPQILILDDSASALDFATDAALRKAIAHETKNMTTVIVSQRVGTVRYSDKILVLDDGKLVGVGKHEQLIKQCDVYKEICLSQLSYEEVHNS